MNRKPYLDILRILALFLVVFNHTALFSPGEISPAEPVYWVILLADECCKLAVPVFFMVSGALLLHRDEPTAALLRKRVLRFVLLILLFVGGQLLFASHVSGMGWSWKRYMASCLTGEIYSHITAAYAVWFLYAYLGMLVLLPLLRRLAQGMANSHFLLLMGLQVACLVVFPAVSCAFTGKPAFFLNRFLPFADGVYPPFCWTHCIFYAFLGYFLEHRMTARPGAGQLAAWGISAGLLLLAGCAAVHATMGTNIDYNPFLKSFLMVPCCYIFLAAKWNRGLAAMPPAAQGLLTWLAGGVFAGIMLENILRHFMLPHVFALLGQGFAAHCAAVAAVSVVALACGSVLKSVPLLRKVL